MERGGWFVTEWKRYRLATMEEAPHVGARFLLVTRSSYQGAYCDPTEFGTWIKITEVRNHAGTTWLGYDVEGAGRFGMANMNDLVDMSEFVWLVREKMSEPLVMKYDASEGLDDRLLRDHIAKAGVSDWDKGVKIAGSIIGWIELYDPDTVDIWVFDQAPDEELIEESWETSVVTVYLCSDNTLRIVVPD